MLSDKIKKLAEINAEITRLTAGLLEAKSALESEIKEEVMSLGSTIEAHGLKVVYSKGRGSYDWAGAVKASTPAIGDIKARLNYISVLEAHTKVVEKVDYAKIAKVLKIDGTPFYKEGSPSVTIKEAG